MAGKTIEAVGEREDAHIKENTMWAKGYREGYYAAVRRLCPELTGEELTEFVEENLYQDSKGEPTYFAVANHCCGGVDAHTGHCRR
jgi:hypothetical protein